MSSEIGISEFIPLSDNQISLNSNSGNGNCNGNSSNNENNNRVSNNISDDSTCSLSHNFIPKLDFSSIQSTILRSNKLLQESKGASIIDKLSFELPTQNELFSVTESRQFSLEVIYFLYYLFIHLFIIQLFNSLNILFFNRLKINHNTLFQLVTFLLIQQL